MEASTAGLTAVALFVLWLGYWVPQLLRHRGQLAEARVSDRYSTALRVIAIGGDEPVVMRQNTTTTPSARLEPGQGGAMVMSSTPGTRGTAVSTRTGSALEIQPQLSARQRLALFEARARRAARARRRLIVTILLFLTSAAAWTCVALDLVHWGAAAAPSALLLLVLIAGRRAAIAARRAEAAWAASRHRARQRATQARALANGGPYVPRNRLRVTGVAVHGSETATQAIPIVEHRDILDEILDEPRVEPVTVLEVDEQGVAAPAEEALGGGLAWNPVPVPLPTYVTKPPAPRREPAPLAEASSEDAAEAASVAEVLQPDIAEERAEDELIRGDVPRTRTETLAQPLEEILARRRAAG